ncbi:hypothetical protein LOD99_8046 [Oopsacas minuta]|uniref:Uncharacterized protein n=1 Tax=Oopsacas minuta TaxID=111878 RepID=A0AAV7JJB2_9METZ|nr:hypothetical protein LOD99_8046 [Oopsacas minuta]
MENVQCNVLYKHVRLNDPAAQPFGFNDYRFSFLDRIVNWLDAWESLPGKDGKLSKQTFGSLRYACIVLPQITNYLTETYGYSYLPTSFIQTDPSEHGFGLYRMMSGANYHISYLQILEAERCLKISNIQIYFPISPNHDAEIDFDPFLNAISDLSSVECDTQTIQSLAFIAGYAAHQCLKRSPPCYLCQDLLTIDKDCLIHESTGFQYRLLELTDREGLKYPSELVLDSIITVWKNFTVIEGYAEWMRIFVEGSYRQILLDLVCSVDDGCWREQCPSCNLNRSSILRKLVFTEANCLIANKVKNYNSKVASKEFEKRKLK